MKEVATEARVKPLIRFTTSGVEVLASPAELDEARAEFERRKILPLPGLLSPELAQRVRAGIESDGFDEITSPRMATQPSAYQGAYQGTRVIQDLRPGEATRLMTERTNDPALFRFAATIAGTPPLARCIGRLSRLMPVAEDLAWHTDTEGGRLLDLVINLSAVPYGGGLFQMRDAHTHRMLNEVGRTEFGDAMLVRLSPDLEHHFTAVTGTVPRVGFSGWFVPRGV